MSTILLSSDAFRWDTVNQITENGPIVRYYGYASVASGKVQCIRYPIPKNQMFNTLGDYIYIKSKRTGIMLYFGKVFPSSCDSLEIETRNNITKHYGIYHTLSVEKYLVYMSEKYLPYMSRKSNICVLITKSDLTLPK